MSERPAVPARDSVHAPQEASRFSLLPRRIPLDEMVESHAANRPADPAFGRNPETDWLIRTCA
ncbi:hypothetical protein [Streptomyces sp. AK02-01A]|uniref:hypothetical protein n=1 Tax=Streptomyces sp. AK02-01A TaxID=3028648 RepID=UPI0029A01DA5|nr:hypothetical protein [Streptomyces sp. AK02-01A]MDX3852697.1 hypothetical protein [Streptomyces sp. AK02-01A]